MFGSSGAANGTQLLPASLGSGSFALCIRR